MLRITSSRGRPCLREMPHLFMVLAMNFPRSSGVLLHPTSLPGPHGVGMKPGAATSKIAARLKELATIYDR
jgi:hypothetical protein